MNISLHKTIHNVPQSVINPPIQFVLFENSRKSERNWFFPLHFYCLCFFSPKKKPLLIFLKLSTTCKTSGSVIPANVECIWASPTVRHTTQCAWCNHEREKNSQFNLCCSSLLWSEIFCRLWNFFRMFIKWCSDGGTVASRSLENHFRFQTASNGIYYTIHHGTVEARMHSLWSNFMMFSTKLLCELDAPSIPSRNMQSIQLKIEMVTCTFGFFLLRVLQKICIN